MYLLFLFRHWFSELPRPIALKLCHMIGIWLNFIIPLQKFGGLSPPKNWGPKMQNLGASQLVTRSSRHNGQLVTITTTIPRTYWQSLAAMVCIWACTVHSRCNTDRQRLKRVRRRLAIVDNPFPEQVVYSKRSSNKTTAHHTQVELPLTTAFFTEHVTRCCGKQAENKALYSDI